MAYRQRNLKAKDFKPCPFCGTTIETILKTEEYVEIECPECNATMREYCDEAEDYILGLKKKWNRRKK